MYIVKHTFESFHNNIRKITDGSKHVKMLISNYGR